MKQAAIVGEREAVLVETEQPSMRDGWALVKVHTAPLCAEYKAFVHGYRMDCLGHEAAGEVVDVAQPGPVKAGDRVVVMPQYPCGTCRLCRAGDYIHCEHNIPYQAAALAQYVAKPVWLLPKIPDGMTYERASLACCGLGASFGALQLLGVAAFDTLLITGLGPVGLGAVINAKFRGARVIGVESNAYRRRLAEELGADIVVDPDDPDVLRRLRALTDGRGPDCAVDCSGAVGAHRLCIDAVRRKGGVAFVGESGHDTPVRISPDMLRKGLRLIGSWHYNLNDFPRLLQVIERSPQLDRFVTHILPMSRVQEALALSASGECGKILLKPWE